MSSVRQLAVESYFSKVNFTKELRLFYRGKKVLVTGGAGAIGTNLVFMLSELVGSKGVVFVLDNLSTNKLAQAIDFPNLPNVLFSKGDISNNIDLKRFLGKA